jgi:hypothetical protein
MGRLGKELRDIAIIVGLWYVFMGIQYYLGVLFQ